MTYTLLFGNNFIANSPKSVKCDSTTLFILGEDSNGPYLTTNLSDLLGKHVLLRIDKNICTYCSNGLVLKRNERNHILVDNLNGENIIQSRILDKTTILVSGMFSIKENVLVVTQNYIVSPSGKRIMHSKISAKNSSVTLTDEEIVPDD
jgi:hypothetical protein